MTRSLVISLIVLFSWKSYALSVITDLDDTLKVTNVLDFEEAARNAIFSKKAFFQMPEVLEAMNDYSHNLYILSASPSFLKIKIEGFIEHNNLQVHELILRDLFRQRDSRVYKLNAMKNIMFLNPSEEFILIGDDTQYDPEVYAEIKKLFPRRVKAIYIRKVTNQQLPSVVKGFYSAFELAIYEYQAGRMDSSEVLKIGGNHALARDITSIIPLFAFCPKVDTELVNIDSIPLKLVYDQYKRRVVKHCINRPLFKVEYVSNTENKAK